MAKKHTKNPLSESFRRMAGLPERKSDEPVTGGDPSPLRYVSEPEGGYGAKGETVEDETSEAPAKEEKEKETSK